MFTGVAGTDTLRCSYIFEANESRMNAALESFPECFLQECSAYTVYAGTPSCKLVNNTRFPSPSSTRGIGHEADSSLDIISTYHRSSPYLPRSRDRRALRRPCRIGRFPGQPCLASTGQPCCDRGREGCAKYAREPREGKTIYNS